MAIYNVPRVQSVMITPNPANQNSLLTISCVIEDVQRDLFPYVSFSDGTNLAGADYVGRTLGKKEYVYAADAYAGEETSECQ